MLPWCGVERPLLVLCGIPPLNVLDQWKVTVSPAYCLLTVATRASMDRSRTSPERHGAAATPASPEYVRSVEQENEVCRAGRGSGVWARQGQSTVTKTTVFPTLACPGSFSASATCCWKTTLPRSRACSTTRDLPLVNFLLPMAASAVVADWSVASRRGLTSAICGVGWMVGWLFFVVILIRDYFLMSPPPHPEPEWRVFRRSPGRIGWARVRGQR